jgi:phenylacetate-CoA ligase
LLLDIFHRLPYPGKVLVATLQGYYLDWLRYGGDFKKRLAEIEECEGWSKERMNAVVQARLQSVLTQAFHHVPYYRDQWAERRRQGDNSDWRIIANWPILEKDEVRRNPHAFLADNRSGFLIKTQTSGTSGKPLVLWQSKEALRTWYAKSEWRLRRWYGVARGQNWGIFGGQLVTDVAQKQPPFWVWNHSWRQLYMSSYHLSPDLIGFYLDALVEHKITYLLGYTSALVAVAQELLARERTDIRLKVVITNAEPLYPYQRKILEAAFNCPVRETYGMSEMVVAASECQHGRLHLWPLAGVVEIIEKGRIVPNGEAGELIATGFINHDMPLIRYRTGDRGMVAVDQSCPCGRCLPILGHIDGRNDDLLYTTEGRAIGRLDTVFKADLPVIEVQIVQKRLDYIVVRYVPTERFNAASSRLIAERLQERMGPLQVDFECLDAIPRGPNGKFRSVVCELTEKISETEPRTSKINSL